MSKLPIALLSIRVSVFVVMFMWTLDKLIHPAHAAGVYEYFYSLSGISVELMRAIGAVEMVILIGFVLGYRKRITYGAVLVLHAVSTLSSYAQYLDPWEPYNLLFFAAWPMLAACFTLYLLRNHDTKLTL
jgi:hypothetical protein